MTNAQIHAIARVFEQDRLANIQGMTQEGAAGALSMWEKLAKAVAEEIRNMHGNVGKEAFLYHVGLGDRPCQS